MIFAVGREINVVIFKTKIMILMIKLKDQGWKNLYAFPLGWKKVLFRGKKAGKKVFFHQKRLGFYICHCWTPCTCSILSFVSSV